MSCSTPRSRRSWRRIYRESAHGQPPIPPAQLALALILQAYTGVSDDEAIEASVMDRRWQLVLDCLDCAAPPFSKGTLVGFRQALVAHELDRRLVERTVRVGPQRGGFGPRQLRAALDSSPLWGAGRAEDTDNLLGHALRQGAGRAGPPAGAGAGGDRGRGRGRRGGRAEPEGGAGPGLGRPGRAGRGAAGGARTRWTRPRLAGRPAGGRRRPGRAAGLAAAREVRAQDVAAGADGLPTLRRGVAADRRISVEDGAMRHGRKSRSRLIDGDKRHVLRDLDPGLVRGGRRDARPTPPRRRWPTAIAADLARQAVALAELHLDRAYLSSALVRDRPAGLAIDCKAWPVQGGDRFPKTAFALDWDAGTIRCPGQVAVPFAPGGTVHVPRRDLRRLPAARPLHHQRQRAAAWRSTPTSACSRSCARASRRRRGAPSCASASRSSTPSRTSATGRATAPATSGSARTSSTCAASPSSITSMSSNACRPPPTRSPPDYLTGALVRQRENL